MQDDAGMILAHSSFLRDVQPAALTRLRQMATLKSWPSHTMIFRQGQPCPGVFLVGTGLVRIFKTAPNGKEHVLHLVAPGGSFAEVAALGNFPCPAFAEALEDTRCVLLPTAPFNAALAADHSLCLGLLKSMAGWVKHMVDSVEDMTLRDALSRVARYLLTTADPTTGRVTLPSMKKHLASQLNLTSETLSRTLRRLSDTGILTSDGPDLIIHDRPAITQLAEGLGPLL